MKIVYASTPSQEQRISELIRDFYTNVFPIYFSDEEIKHFENLKVLHISSRHFEYFGTLKEAFQVISSLQTLSFILQFSQFEEKYESLFYQNISILEKFGLSFPFEFHQFQEYSSFEQGPIFSTYVKPANEMLI